MTTGCNIDFLNLDQKMKLYDLLLLGDKAGIKMVFDEIDRLENVIKHSENIFDYIKSNKENMPKAFTNIQIKI